MEQEDKIKCVVSDTGTIIPINTIAAISGKNCIHHIWTNRDQDHEGYRLSDKQYNILIKELKILSNDPDEEKHIEEIFPKFKVGDIVRNIDSGELFHIEKVDSRNYWDGRDSFCIINQEQWERVEQKSSWSKEDEMQLDAAIHLVSSTGHIETANWLKALKDRVQPQPQQGWSEDTQQWIDVIIKDYEDLYNADKDHRATIQAKINILKSLRPQPTWKPSDEQIEALESATENCAYSEYQDCLRELIEQLKKLREE